MQNLRHLSRHFFFVFINLKNSMRNVFFFLFRKQSLSKIIHEKRSINTKVIICKYCYHLNLHTLSSLSLFNFVAKLTCPFFFFASLVSC